MRNHNKILLLPVMLALLFASCSKKTTETEQKVQKPGTVQFRNQSGVQVRLDNYAHRHGSQSVSVNLLRSIGNGASYTLSNLIEGGASFKGGDVITIEFRCYLPSEEIKKTVVLAVDGDEQITVLERCTYDTG